MYSTTYIHDIKKEDIGGSAIPTGEAHPVFWLQIGNFKFCIDDPFVLDEIADMADDLAERIRATDAAPEEKAAPGGEEVPC